ncbi:MAG: leucyl aminopeptidase [Patescibacteria group bacterium]|nr:leucyl aminopeptidase [Patescibacteria group bacterium]
MKCNVTLHNAPFPSTGELLALPVFSENGKTSPRIAELNTITKGQLLERIKQEAFTGKRGQLLAFDSDCGYTRIILVGMGKQEQFSFPLLENTVADAVRHANSVRATRLDVYLDPVWKQDYREIGRLFATAANLANYSFVRYKSHEKTEGPSYLSELRICLEASLDTAQIRGELKEGIALGVLISEGMYLTRDLVNEPASAIYPETLAEQAYRIANNSKGTVSIKVLEASECEQLGMGSYLAVGQGSDNPPKFIILHFARKKPKRMKRIALIGKSVTFDTGGYQVKPGEYMNDMKIDMAGGAAVLGVFSILSQWNEERFGAIAYDEVFGILPACENMISGRAFRPGDVLTAMNGKTIEVKHTDAEGRLTLADALAYASRELKCEYAIDIATLTGAVMVALGNDIAGVFGNDDAFTREFLSAAQLHGEEAWQLPLSERYRDHIKGTIADLANLGKKDRYGGAITAALFLEEFVDEMKWIHVDIAGSCYTDDPPRGITGTGATAWGVRTLLSVLTKTV